MIEGEYWHCDRQDGERWRGPHATREAALAEAREYHGSDDAVYTAKGMYPTLGLDKLGESVLERLRDHLWDSGQACEDFGEEWPHRVDKAEYAMLDKLLADAVRKWLDDTGRWPQSWVVMREIQRHDPEAKPDDS